MVTITHEVKQLRFFRKNELAPGETKNRNVHLAYPQSFFVDANFKLVIEVGEFYV